MDLEEALAQADVYAEETEVCTIDNDLRTITVPSGLQTVGVESDEDVRRLNFQMPKQYGEVDLSEFDIRINFMNANNSGDVYAVTDKAISGDNITFSWLVGRNALAYRGNIRFIVCLKKTDAEGVVQQEFNTTVATLSVLEGLETTEQVIQENPDIIEQILTRLDELEENGGGGSTPGKDGREIELQNSGTAIQWRYSGESEWKDLVQLSDLTAPATNGIPTGGTTGQVLVKKSDADFDAEWKTINEFTEEEPKPTYKNLIDPSNYSNTGYSNKEDFPNDFNVFDGFSENYIDVGENKYIYYRIYRNNKVTSVLNLNVCISCYGEGNSFSNWYKDTNLDKNNSQVQLFNEINHQYDINGIENVDGVTVYNKGFVRFTIPEGTKSIKFSVASNSNMSTELYSALWVSFEPITNYGSITQNDLLPVVAESPENGEDSGGGTTVSAYKPLLNKSIYFIGDSLTHWGGGSDIADGFLKIIHDRTGASMVNKGLVGATWEEAEGQTEPGVKRVDEYIQSDIKYDCICFLLGTNMANQGTVDDTSETKTTMCGAIKYCLEKLISYSPTTPILVFLPPQRAGGNPEQKNKNQLIKQICEIYAVKTKDLYIESQIIPNTVVANNNNLSDGLHLNVNGYTNAGRVMTSAILDIMGY